MRVGLVSYGAEVNCHSIAQRYLEETIRWMEELRYEMIAIEKLVMEDDANAAAIRRLRTGAPDALVIQIGTFTQGNMLMDLLMEMEEIPVFVWGFNDPIVESWPTIPLNSLTGMVMLTSYMKKIGKKFSYGYGDFADEKIREKVTLFIEAIRIKKELRHTKYAVIGSRVPGFYRCAADELRFRKQVGPEIEYVSLATVIDAARSMEEARVRKQREDITEKLGNEITEEMLERTIRLELAVSDYVKMHNISAVTMKCWPELQAIYQCAGCGVLSRLNDKGITACCEGDVLGLATMDILRKITGRSVFFADLVAAPKMEGIKAWHCGFGPRALAKKADEVMYVEQATMRNGIGVGVQYEMKEGRLSMCKLSEQDDCYAMLLAGGTGVEADRKLAGVQTDIRLDAGFEKVLDTIIENGFEQHYGIVHTDVGPQMKELAKWMDLRLITV